MIMSWSSSHLHEPIDTPGPVVAEGRDTQAGWVGAFSIVFSSLLLAMLPMHPTLPQTAFLH